MRREKSTPVLARATNLSLSNLLQSIDSPLLHAATLNLDAALKLVRKTSIIATIGPKTNGVDAIVALRKAGINIVRMNFSHGTHEIKIRMGHKITFSTDDEYKEAGRQLSEDSSVVYIDYKNIVRVLKPGNLIYVDDGTLMFRVDEVEGHSIRATALNNGKITSRKGCNLPGTDIDLPALSEKDIKDLAFAVEHGVDMIFASFIRSAENVRLIRDTLGEKGRAIKIISKIENHQGLNNFDEILDESDGIMVARGDLGTEIPIEKIFLAQKRIIAKCNIFAKPVICATQMLHTMQFTPRPTRAEVSDVANAVFDGADCVMLSGETASGDFPVESVEYMAKICKEAESTFTYSPFFNDIRAVTARPTATVETIASSAVNASFEENADAIIVLTTSGQTARFVSKYRPRCPIICVTRSASTAKQIHLHRGCYPLVYPEKKPETGDQSKWQDDVDRRISWAMKQAREMGILKEGDVIIAVQGWRSGSGSTNTMRVIASE